MDKKMKVSDKMICIACLKSKQTVKKITDEQLLQCYNSILEEIPVPIPNSQPSMCSKCTDLLKKCSAFKQKIKESYKRLQIYSDENLQKFLPEIDTELKCHGPRAKPEAIDIVDDMFVKEEVKVEFDNDLQKTEIDALGDSPDISHSEMSADDNENTKDDVVKKIKVKKTKKCPKNSLTKKEQNIINTIELSYEEMLEDRQKEAVKECFLNAKYRCDSCYLVFAYQKSLDVHMKTKHDPTIGDYSCPVCNVVIPSVEAFTAHYKRHMRRYECSVCQKRAADMKAIQRHYYGAHAAARRDYTCGLCGMVFKTMDAHRYHKDTHKQGRVQCGSCDKTFRHRNGLANHRMTVHESSGKIICAHCGKEFRWRTSLKRHEDRHHGTKQQSAAVPSCQSCDITFASMSSYLRHMKNSLKHVSKDQLRYICDECGRRYANKTKLRDHIEEKHLHRKFSCHICNKPSKNRVALDQHIRNVHKGRPNNKMCHQCGKGFPTKVQLESHLRAHTGERPFICEHCPTTFSQHSNLYKHTRQVHMNIKKQLPKKPGETRTPDPGKPEASTSVLEATVLLTHPGFVI